MEMSPANRPKQRAQELLDLEKALGSYVRGLSNELSSLINSLTIQEPAIQPKVTVEAVISKVKELKNFLRDLKHVRAKLKKD